MFTDNKVHEAERDYASLAKSPSGGVDEPSDPKHFPVLASSVTSPRALSRLQGSFKDKLLAESADESESSGQSSEGRTEAASATIKADYTRSASPRISAGRDCPQVVVGAASGEASEWGAKEKQEVGQIYFNCSSSSLSCCHTSSSHVFNAIHMVPMPLLVVAGSCYACRS